MSKSITLTHYQWDQLRARLRQDYPPSVILIRSKMRKVLGFTDREHREYEYIGEFRAGYDLVIKLDFFDEPKRLMFLLKYSEYLEK